MLAPVGNPYFSGIPVRRRESRCAITANAAKTAIFKYLCISIIYLCGLLFPSRILDQISLVYFPLLDRMEVRSAAPETVLEHVRLVVHF